MDTKTYLTALESHGKEKYKQYAPYRVNVPKGTKGPWTVREFETDFGLSYLRLARDGRPPGLGKFTALNHKERGMIMSDTCPEVDDVRAFAYLLRGHVLISGLGLGMVPHMLTKVPKYSENVTSLMIVEKDADVIALTGDHYRKSDKRISIVHADALKWTPPKGTKYDAAWHDIWGDICADNRPEMTAIKRHYQRYVKAGQQFCWGQMQLDQERRQNYR
jgi:hypothetical protein